MKNFLRLALVVLLLVAFKNSWALEPTTNNTVAATPLATVNIQEAKIVSQDGNNFKVSFFITNREGLQTGVKYGVRLYTQDEKKKLDIVVSEKVYDEELKLSPGARVKKEIDYTAPDVLSGEYNIALLSYNTKGFPLAFATLGKVKITRALTGVEILNDSCFIKTNNEESKVGVAEHILIKPEDNIYLNCSAINHDSKQMTVAPIFETRLGSAYGENVYPTGGDDKGIIFKASEKKDFSVLVPTKSIDPQAYNLSFYLKGDESNSNQVKLDYKISGISATLYNVSLDKSNYNKGDIAKVTALLKLNKAEASESEPLKYYLNVNILNDKNNKCGKSFTKEIDNSFISNFDLEISSKCSRPQIIASITDSNGKILSQMGNSSMKNKFNLNNLEYIITALAIIILIILIIISRRSKKVKNNKESYSKQDNQNGGTITTVVLLIAASLFANFLFTNKASADTFCLTRMSSCDVLSTVNLDKSAYQPGENMIATGFITSSLYWTSAFLYGWPSDLSYSLTATQSTTKSFSNPASSNSTVTFTAPSSSGSYSLALKSGAGCSPYYRLVSPNGTDAGCATPGLTQTSNTGVPSDTATPRYRKQIFMVNAGVAAGDIYSVTVYSHTVAVVAVAGDTQNSIASKMASAINNTTVAQWDEFGSAAYTGIGTTSYGTYSFNGQTKPYATTNGIEFTIALNWQNQFGGSASPADSTGDWKYATYNLGYSVTPPPTISVTSSYPSISSGNCVDVRWAGSNLDNCTLSKTDLVTSVSIDFTPADMNPNGTYHDCPQHTTKYTANCSNIKPSCTGISSADNYFCYNYSYMDEACYLDTNHKCTWN